MIIGIGTDVVDVARFRALLDDARVAELFLPDETAYCSARARPWECFAARAAAKRAFLHALAGTGIGAPAAAWPSADGTAPPDTVFAGDAMGEGALWHDVEILRRASGDVDIRITGRALEAAGAVGASRWSLSIAHTKNTALAVVVLEQPGSRDAHE